MTVRPLDPAVIATDRGADRPTSAEDILDPLDALRPAWHADAACRDVGLDVMFPSAVDSHGTKGRVVEEAEAICWTCPVITECAEAGRNERFGVWAGVAAVHRHVGASLRSDMERVLADGEWHTAPEIATATDATHGHTLRALRHLHRDGRVERRPYAGVLPGRRPDDYRLTPEGP